MRIQYITISGLFGMFDHRIPMFPSDPITIIHGPNGIGKTSILRLIYGTLKPDYSHLRQVPFSEIEIQFEDDIALAASLSAEEHYPEEVSRRPGSANRNRGRIEFPIVYPGGRNMIFKRAGMPYVKSAVKHPA